MKSKLILVCLKTDNVVQVMSFSQESFTRKDILDYIVNGGKVEFDYKIRIKESPCTMQNLKNSIGSFFQRYASSHEFDIVYLCDTKSGYIYETDDMNKDFKKIGESEALW